MQRLLNNIINDFKVEGSRSKLCSSSSRFLSKLVKSIILEDNTSCAIISNDKYKHSSAKARNISIEMNCFVNQIYQGRLSVDKVDTVKNGAI